MSHDKSFPASAAPSSSAAAAAAAALRNHDAVQNVSNRNDDTSQFTRPTSRFSDRGDSHLQRHRLASGRPSSMLPSPSVPSLRGHRKQQPPPPRPFSLTDPSAPIHEEEDGQCEHHRRAYSLTIQKMNRGSISSPPCPASLRRTRPLSTKRRPTSLAANIPENTQSLPRRISSESKIVWDHANQTLVMKRLPSQRHDHNARESLNRRQSLSSRSPHPPGLDRCCCDGNTTGDDNDNDDDDNEDDADADLGIAMVVDVRKRCSPKKYSNPKTRENVKSNNRSAADRGGKAAAAAAAATTISPSSRVTQTSLKVPQERSLNHSHSPSRNIAPSQQFRSKTRRSTSLRVPPSAARPRARPQPQTQPQPQSQAQHVSASSASSPSKSVLKRVTSCPPVSRRRSELSPERYCDLHHSTSKRKPRVNFDESRQLTKKTENDSKEKVPAKTRAKTAREASNSDELNDFTISPPSRLSSMKQNNDAPPHHHHHHDEPLHPQPSSSPFTSVEMEGNAVTSNKIARKEDPKSYSSSAHSHASPSSDLEPIDPVNNDNGKNRDRNENTLHQSIDDEKHESDGDQADYSKPIGGTATAVAVLPSGDSGCSFMPDETKLNFDENDLDGKRDDDDAAAASPPPLPAILVDNASERSLERDNRLPDSCGRVSRRHEDDHVTGDDDETTRKGHEDENDNNINSLIPQPETPIRPSSPQSSKADALDINPSVRNRNKNDKNGHHDALIADLAASSATSDSPSAGNNTPWTVSSLLANWFSSSSATASTPASTPASITTNSHNNIINAKNNDAETATGTPQSQLLPSNNGANASTASDVDASGPPDRLGSVSASVSESESESESIYVDAREYWEEEEDNTYNHTASDENTGAETLRPALVTSVETADASEGDHQSEEQRGEEKGEEKMNVFRSASPALLLPRRSKTNRRSRIGSGEEQQQQHKYHQSASLGGDLKPTVLHTQEIVAARPRVNPLKSHPVTQSPIERPVTYYGEYSNEKPSRKSLDDRRKSLAVLEGPFNKENSKPIHHTNSQSRSNQQRTSHQRQSSSNNGGPESVHVPKTRKPYRNDVANANGESSSLPRPNVFLSPATSHTNYAGPDDTFPPAGRRSSHLSSDGSTIHPLTELYSLGSEVNGSASSFKKRKRASRKSNGFGSFFRGQSPSNAVPFPAMTKVTAEKSLRQPGYRAPRPMSMSVVDSAKTRPMSPLLAPSSPLRQNHVVEDAASTVHPMGVQTMRTSDLPSRVKPRRRLSDSDSDDCGGSSVPFMSSLSGSTVRRHRRSLSSNSSDDEGDADGHRAKRISNHISPAPAAPAVSQTLPPANQVNSNTSDYSQATTSATHARRNSVSKRPLKKILNIFSRSSRSLSKLDISPPVANQGSVNIDTSEGQGQETSMLSQASSSHQPQPEVPSRVKSQRPTSVVNPMGSAVEYPSTLAPVVEGSSSTVHNNSNNAENIRARASTPTPSMAGRTSSFKSRLPSFIRRGSRNSVISMASEDGQRTGGEGRKRSLLGRIR